MNQDVLKKAFDDLLKSKTGEGSRGGKIIGHTRSGKPIYESTDDKFNPKDKRRIKGYTTEDHLDAAALHKVLKDNIANEISKYKNSGHYDGIGHPKQDEHDRHHHALAFHSEKVGSDISSEKRQEALSHYSKKVGEKGDARLDRGYRQRSPLKEDGDHE